VASSISGLPSLTGDGEKFKTVQRRSQYGNLVGKDVSRASHEIAKFVDISNHPSRKQLLKSPDHDDVRAILKNGS
jgi:hypothetical protein